MLNVNEDSSVTDKEEERKNSNITNIINNNNINNFIIADPSKVPP